MIVMTMHVLLQTLLNGILLLFMSALSKFACLCLQEVQSTTLQGPADLIVDHWMRFMLTDY